MSEECLLLVDSLMRPQDMPYWQVLLRQLAFNCLFNQSYNATIVIKETGTGFQGKVSPLKAVCPSSTSGR